MNKCFGYPDLYTMYSIIIAHYGLLAGQYTFTNTSLYFDTLWMGPPQWMGSPQWRSCLSHRNAKCVATDAGLIPVPAESHHIFRYTVGLP